MSDENTSDLSKLLEKIELGLANTLLERVKSKDCDAATLNAARAYLKDRDFSSLPSSNPHLTDLKDKLGDVPEPGTQLKFGG